ALATGGPSRALEPLAERIFLSLSGTARRKYAIESFLASRQGRLLARRTEINSIEDLAERLATERAAALGGELEAQLRKIDSALDRFRRIRREGGEVVSGQALSRNEKFLIRFLVKRYLKLADPDQVVRTLLPR